jgi:hypothetical protein
MTQMIRIEDQTEQPGLAHLHAQRASGRESRELALHRNEPSLDQSPAAIKASRVCSEAAATTANKFAQSFQGPRGAICDNRNYYSRSATTTTLASSARGAVFPREDACAA